MRHRRRLTARARLTLVTLALFVGLSLVLVSVNYLVVSSLTDVDPTDPPPEAFSELGIELPDPTRSAEALESAFGVDVREVFERASDEARRDLLNRLLASSAIAVAVAGVLAWLVAGRVARGALAPVHQITGMARTLSGDSLDRRLALDGPDDELKELADTFDEMLARLQSSFESRRRFGAYASHELRTPLTTLRAEAELTLADPASASESRRLAHAAIDTVERADRLLSGLLVLGRAETGVLATQAVDLAEVTGDVVGELVEEADRAGVDIDLDLQRGVVAGDASLLRSLVHNLVRNAVQYNDRGGRVDVRVATAGGERVELRVVNDGPVLTAQEIEQMSLPFQRLALSRTAGPGHGLGTTIVSVVAAGHGGTATWHARPTGGVCAVVSLLGAQRSS